MQHIELKVPTSKSKSIFTVQTVKSAVRQLIGIPAGVRDAKIQKPNAIKLL